MLDLSSVDAGSNFLSIRLGNGDGTFALASTTAFDAHANSTAYRITSGDLNRDGVNDLVVGASKDSGTDTVTICLGNTEQTASMQYLDLTTQAGARQALTTVAQTQNRISMQLGRLGAALSRFETALANTSASMENYRAAESRIMDADIAESSAALVRTQILQQAGAAVLAQVIEEPRLALQLLS